MTRLADSDRHFLAQRARRLRWWPPLAGLLLLMLLGLTAWLWIKTPYLINPYHVAEHLSRQTFATEMLPLMAVFLPMCVIALLVLTTSLLVFGFAVFRNEKRYQALIRALEQQPPPGD